jgi:hypothetical protein
MIVEWKSSSKQNKIGQLTIKIYTFERAENFKYLDVVLAWSYWSPIGCLPRWRTGECSLDMGGTGEIKYPGQTKTSTTALWFAEGSVRARGRKP